MSFVFLDTLGLIAVVNQDDQWHVRANVVWRELLARRTKFVTTSLVLIELGDGLSRIRERHLAVQLYDRLRNTNAVEIVHPSEELEHRGWTLYIAETTRHSSHPRRLRFSSRWRPRDFEAALQRRVGVMVSPADARASRTAPCARR